MDICLNQWIENSKWVGADGSRERTLALFDDKNKCLIKETDERDQ